MMPSASSPRTARPRSLDMVMVSSCPPRPCGVATFAADLASAIAPGRARWAAIDRQSRDFAHPVRWLIDQDRADAWWSTGDSIAASSADVVLLQHEFGLFGPDRATALHHLSAFLDAVDRPVVSVPHTILADLDLGATYQAMAAAGRLVTMTHAGRELLIERHRIDPARISVVPHGVPAPSSLDRPAARQALGLGGRRVIVTFGLLDPRKGIEYAIEAMTRVTDREPNALYVVVGATHPELVRHSGEAYRHQLEGRARTLGLGDHVRFVDRYLDLDQIVTYLAACDVYVTPYLDPNQCVSGTLSYALGAGRACVSTAYPHAREALAAGRGSCVDFRDSDTLATAIIGFLENGAARRAAEHAALAYSQASRWPAVGRAYHQILDQVVAEHRKLPVAS